jgi:stage III sporulation protein AA
MTCAWKELLSILPPGIAVQMTGETRDRVQEIRLRLGQVPELVCWPESVWLKGLVSRDDLNFVVNTASRYSPWSAQTAAKGYLTAAGGHRIGICGETIMKDGILTGIRTVTSLCIRVARDYPNIAEDASMLKGSILIIGPPGSGKTTLLRDLIRYISVREYVGVVDERGELFPECDIVLGWYAR